MYFKMEEEFNKFHGRDLVKKKKKMWSDEQINEHNQKFIITNQMALQQFIMNEQAILLE